MTLKWIHSFLSAKAEGVDSTLVGPNEWNAPHQASSDTDGFVVGRPVGAGAGPLQELPIAQMFLAPGIVTPFAGSVAPTGWLLCDGSAVSRTGATAALYAAIGTGYGVGDGSSTFNLPDCRARVVAMPDGGTNRWPGLALGVAGGSLDRQPRHYGNVQVYGEQDGINLGTTGVDNASDPVGGPTGSGDVTMAAHTHLHSLPVFNVGFTSNGSVVNNGNNVTDVFDVAQPTISMNYIIKT